MYGRLDLKASQVVGNGRVAIHGAMHKNRKHPAVFPIGRGGEKLAIFTTEPVNQSSYLKQDRMAARTGVTTPGGRMCFPYIYIHTHIHIYIYVRN